MTDSPSKTLWHERPPNTYGASRISFVDEGGRTVLVWRSPDTRNVMVPDQVLKIPAEVPEKERAAIISAFLKGTDRYEKIRIKILKATPVPLPQKE